MLQFKIADRKWRKHTQEESPPPSPKPNNQPPLYRFPSIPRARSFHTCVRTPSTYTMSVPLIVQVCYGNGMYMFGGKSNGYLNDLYRFDFGTILLLQTCTASYVLRLEVLSSGHMSQRMVESPQRDTVTLLSCGGMLCTSLEHSNKTICDILNL